MEQTIVLHAKERGEAPANIVRTARMMKIAYFDAVVVPRNPIKKGQRVCISKLKRLPDRYTGPYRAPPQYESKRTDIEGPVVAIRARERHFVELVVQNTLTSSLVEKAWVAIPHIQGVTVDLGGWDWLLAVALYPTLPETRRIDLENDAIII
ncbi:hypothetical protein FKP32DRAFT_1554588, partial [Trametes sanguinea]